MAKLSRYYILFICSDDGDLEDAVMLLLLVWTWIGP